jgi:hypothetical protein
LPRESDVFLSYHWRDQWEVDALVRRLHEQGLAVFLDCCYLTPGQPWPQALERVLATWMPWISTCREALDATEENPDGSVNRDKLIARLRYTKSGKLSWTSKCA